MKSIGEFRARKIEYLQFLMKCPERCGGVDQEVRGWLSDMLFIDERFGTWEKEKKRLERTGRYSTLGVYGPFAWGLPRPLRADFQRPMAMECMSVYGEVLWRMGYLQVSHEMPVNEWRAIRDSLQLLKRGEWHTADVTARFGEPSLVLNGGNPLRRCHCYASADKEAGWICFDYEFLIEGYVGAAPGSEEDPETPLIEGKPWHEHPDHAQENPLLRDVRFPMANFEAGLVLTEYAKRIQMNPFGMFPRK